MGNRKRNKKTNKIIKMIYSNAIVLSLLGLTAAARKLSADDNKKMGDYLGYVGAYEKDYKDNSEFIDTLECIWIMMTTSMSVIIMLNILMSMTQSFADTISSQTGPRMSTWACLATSVTKAKKKTILTLTMLILKTRVSFCRVLAGSRSPRPPL